MQYTDSEISFKQNRNLMWTVRNLSVFTAFPAHVHGENRIMQNKWCYKRPSNLDFGEGVTVCVYMYMHIYIYMHNLRMHACIHTCMYTYVPQTYMSDA